MELITSELKEEIIRHIDSVKRNLGEAEAILIAANANLYYTSGRFFRGYTLIHRDHKPLWFVIKPTVFQKEEDVYFIRKPEEIPLILKDLGFEKFNSIALEENDLTYADIIRLKALFPEADLINGSPIMKKARMVKTDWEISEMVKDGHHQCRVYAEVKDCYKPGMSDLDLQIEIERRLRLEGSLGVSRMSGNLMEINLGSVISGKNADNPGPYEFTMGGAGVHPALPVGADNTEILKGSTVMIDMNGAFNGYQTDMTRIWSLGEVSTLAKRAHECSVRILRSLEKISLPGFPVKDMYDVSMSIVKEEGLENYFMGHRSQAGFIGHGVGIELNELPVVMAKSKDVLQENMTLALEPKFVIPEVGAVGVENTYVVRKHGLENITPFPEEIQDLL